VIESIFALDPEGVFAQAFNSACLSALKVQTEFRVGSRGFGHDRMGEVQMIVIMIVVVIVVVLSRRASQGNYAEEQRTNESTTRLSSGKC
jgi:nitric oxide reductase large subunit